MTDNQADRWSAVDGYIARHLLGDDPALAAALAANAAGGLPAIDVSAPQGKMLELFARMIGACAVLEVGTLGGYSTICLARALPEDGSKDCKVISLELNPHHAEVARANVARAGLAGRVEIRVGPALESLAAMQEAGEGPFDLVFIDADKRNNANYVTAALAMTRKGSVIIVDNVVQEGRIADPGETDPMVAGAQRVFELVSGERRLSATAVQTVGTKGWDGFLLAIVE